MSTFAEQRDAFETLVDSLDNITYMAFMTIYEVARTEGMARALGEFTMGMAAPENSLEVRLHDDRTTALCIGMVAIALNLNLLSIPERSFLP